MASSHLKTDEVRKEVDLMQIEVIYRTVTPSPSITAYAEKHFQKAARLAQDSTLKIMLSSESGHFLCAAHLDEPGRNFSASESNEDLYAAIDLCSDRLSQLLRKASEKDNMIDRDTVRHS